MIIIISRFYRRLQRWARGRLQVRERFDPAGDCGEAEATEGGERGAVAGGAAGGGDQQSVRPPQGDPRVSRLRSARRIYVHRNQSNITQCTLQKTCFSTTSSKQVLLLDAGSGGQI